MSNLQPTKVDWERHLKGCHHCQYWSRYSETNAPSDSAGEKDKVANSKAMQCRKYIHRECIEPTVLNCTGCLNYEPDEPSALARGKGSVKDASVTSLPAPTEPEGKRAQERMNCGANL